MNIQTETETHRPGSGAMFDQIAGRYDLLNRLLSVGLDKSWRRRAAAALLGSGRESFADIASGTGDLAFEILERYPRSSVTAIDPSRRMLDVMVGKAGPLVGERLTIRQGEAEHIDDVSECYDGVTISFGLRNVADRGASLREMLRILRPGRRLVILEFTEPRGGPMAALARFHIHQVVPRLGAILSGHSEYRYLQSSIEAFPSASELEIEIREAGAERVWIEPMCFGAVHLFIASRGVVGP